MWIRYFVERDVTRGQTGIFRVQYVRCSRARVDATR